MHHHNFNRMPHHDFDHMHSHHFMGGGNFLTGGLWTQFFTVALLVLSFYFTLTFFQQLRADDPRVANRSKWAAVICLALALISPAVFNLLFFQSFMR